jgi:hypothetical protein
MTFDRMIALARRAAAPLAATCAAFAFALAASAAVAAAQEPQEPDEPEVVEVEAQEPAPPGEDEMVEEAAREEAAVEEPPPPAAPPPAADLELAQATMGRLLEVGRALHSWARDTRLERARRPPVYRVPKQVRWERCPGVSHAELVALLVPAYLRELPAEDAWERPLDFCLDRRLTDANEVYGVRSAGADGTFEAGGAYTVGGFPETQLDDDLVWMDGHFARWPEPQ